MERRSSRGGDDFEGGAGQAVRFERARAGDTLGVTLETGGAIDEEVGGEVGAGGHACEGSPFHCEEASRTGRARRVARASALIACSVTSLADIGYRPKVLGHTSEAAAWARCTAGGADRIAGKTGAGRGISVVA